MTTIVIIILSTLVFSFAISYLSVLDKLNKVNVALAKSLSDSLILEQYIDKFNSEVLTDESVHRENFIKFLSDSRDLAFSYIDDVQKSISQIIDNTEKTVQYHKDFGSLEIEPYGTHISTLVDGLEELKKLLPMDESEIKQ